MLIDDTIPNDVYSAIPDVAKCMRYRKAAGLGGNCWHGDVFKMVFYIHDFWPGLNFRTIVGSGNPQTLVWHSRNARRRPALNNLERISRLTYFDLQEYLHIMQIVSEDEAIALCVAEASQQAQIDAVQLTTMLAEPGNEHSKIPSGQDKPPISPEVARGQ